MLVERKAAEPVLPVWLFRNRTVVLAITAGLVIGVGLYACSTFLSQYFQLARRKVAARRDPGPADDPRGRPGLDAAAYGLLAHLADHGPQRPSDLPDAEDGRAHRLALTGEGRRRLAEARDSRRGRLRDHLASWPDDDVRMLASLLARFNAVPPAVPARDAEKA
ncbi:hypothetical protein [Actinoplanes sp. NPDC051411]|uniref:MarR family winged helix-turn-helix transcriptional regulator n=1 Tax=Actinoplanes sp. NPDC051411 TaxID=3155522 RepID=UPI003432B8F3